MNGKVIVFKMINGEEIMGEVFNTFNDLWEIKHPSQIILQRNEAGNMGVAIAPYMPYADGNIKLYKQAVAAHCEPDKNLVNEYNRIFGAGIQIAPASVLASL